VCGGDNYVGGLAGANYGTISNCRTSARVRGDYWYVGGLVGRNYGTVSGCQAEIDEIEGKTFIGGLVGFSDNGTVLDCTASGTISPSDAGTVGGLVGYNLDGAVTNCSSSGVVSAPGLAIGGLMGVNFEGVVTNCWSSAITTSPTGSAGGLVGVNAGDGSALIGSSYSTGDVWGGGFTNGTGGLVGMNYGQITDCYSTSNVYRDYCAGGLVGDNTGRGYISNCYSAGVVSSTGPDVGGLVGYNHPGGVVLDSFWDVETSGQNSSYGGTGKTTAEMHTESTFTSAGWDFNTPVWRICEGLGYPALFWQEGASIGLWPLMLEFSAHPGGPNPESKILTVSNCGCGRLHWEIMETCPWLSVVPGSGECTTEADEVLVSVDTSILGRGSYSYNLTIVDANATNSPQKVKVSLIIREYGGGSGTAEDPYLIYTPDQMNAIGANPSDLDRHFKLMADIDLSAYTGTEFNLIGHSSTWPSWFSGTFDGNGHAIWNFTHDAIEGYRTGLFGDVWGADAEVKDLGLINPYVKVGTGHITGALVGILEDAKVTRCYVEGGTVRGQWYTGGLVGENNGTISESWSSARVVGYHCAGGLVGRNSGRISECYSTGDAIADSGAGGLAGDNTDLIEYSYSSGQASATERHEGGLVGSNWQDTAIIVKCFWDRETSGLSNMCGFQSSGASGCNNAYGKMTLQMYQEGTFTSGGWDFDTPIWVMWEEPCYPRLWWQDDGPLLGVRPLQMQVDALEGRANPPSKTLDICGVGDIEWQLAEDCNWLAVEPNSGGLGVCRCNDVAVSVDTSGMPKGNYYCDLIVSDPCAENSPQTVQVHLVVHGPDLEVAPGHLEFLAELDEPNVFEQILEVRNDGGGTLNWDINVPNDCSWLTVNPLSGTSGGEVNEVSITVDSSGLGLGFHECELTVSDNNATNSPQTVLVLLHVYVPGERHVPGEYATIQAAIDASNEHDTIIVQARTYNENIDFGGKNLTVRSANPGDEGVVAATIIEGAETNPVVTLAGGQLAGCELCGFTITGGAQGIYCESADPSISNCIIAENAGVGIHCVDSDPAVTDCLVFNNGADGIILSSSRFNNRAIIKNCRIVGNVGKGICSNKSLDWIGNCVIAGNRAEGIWSYRSRLLTIRNCTIVANAQAGIYSDYATTNILNSIIWDNASQVYSLAGNVTGTYNNVEGGFGGLGNIEADPCFAEPGHWGHIQDPNIHVEPNDPNAVWLDGDYHLKTWAWRWDPAIDDWNWDEVTSRCIDAGNPGSVPGEEPLWVPVDPDNVWGHNLRVNMGAYGGTAEASMAPYDWALLADLTNDGTVDFVDVGHEVENWLGGGSDLPGDLDRNERIDMADLALLGQDFCEQTTWNQH
ncbi:MAG: GLUG motif-containing protein, partial [Planctomycetota bacterium]